MNNWMRYAQWELDQKEYRRARSIFERGLDVSIENVTLWIRYIESEMKNRNINHCRNLLDRAMSVLPRVDKFWYKAVYFEELLGNPVGCRSVFSRWMQWEPGEAAWSAYIKFEQRWGEIDKARDIFNQFVKVHPEAKNWLKYARWAEANGDVEETRQVFGSAINALGDEFMNEKLIIAYARFEAKLKEHDRSRAIYKYALDRLPRSKTANLYDSYTTFEKQFGDREDVENVIASKRRVLYENQVQVNPKNYDAWLDYAQLESNQLESQGGSPERVRKVYERAIAQMPPTQRKHHWRRYIYLFIFYALFEELVSKDIRRASQIYSECLRIIPHQQFTFAKIWLYKAQFEIRQNKLPAARKTFEQALDVCPKNKIFKNYIDLELKLFEFARCRTIYARFIEFNPSNSSVWIQFAELERGLGDIERARSIFELGTTQNLDMPELLWKNYIDFEEEEAEEEGRYDRPRALYERLLSKAAHLKVWMSYAKFELGIRDPEGEELGNENKERPPTAASIARARAILERAHERLKSLG